MITKELIEARITELQTQAEKIKADFNAVTGAIQDCTYWLDQLDAPDDGQKE